MAQSVSGGGKRSSSPNYKVEKKTTSNHTIGGDGKIVLHNIEVITQREVVRVPEIVVEEQTTVKYTPVEEKTVKYVVDEQDTIKYNKREEETIRYIPHEEETIKYVPREVEIEKPILVDKPYERPVVTNKEYTIATIADMENVRELLDILPGILKQLHEIRDYKLVEEVIKVPKIHYVPTTIKKVGNTGELIDDAN